MRSITLICLFFLCFTSYSQKDTYEVCDTSSSITKSDFYNRSILFLKENMIQCSKKKHFGIDCYGCGGQRSFIALLEGDFKKSFILYPPLTSVIFMLVYFLLHLVINFKNGSKWLLYIFLFNAGILLFHFLYKIFLL